MAPYDFQVSVALLWSDILTPISFLHQKMELFISITTGQIRSPPLPHVYEAIKPYKKRRVLLVKLVNQNGLWVGVTWSHDIEAIANILCFSLLKSIYYICALFEFKSIFYVIKKIHFLAFSFLKKIYS